MTQKKTLSASKDATNKRVFYLKHGRSLAVASGPSPSVVVWPVTSLDGPDGRQRRMVIALPSFPQSSYVVIFRGQMHFKMPSWDRFMVCIKSYLDVYSL